jgi:hypothetical protein
MRAVPTLDGRATGSEFGLPAPEPTGVWFGLIELIAKARPALPSTSPNWAISLRPLPTGTSLHVTCFEEVLSKTRKLMNAHPELASAMLAIALAAVLLLTGQIYMEHRATREARSSSAAWTRQADVRQGSDIRLSQRSSYMRSER